MKEFARNEIRNNLHNSYSDSSNQQHNPCKVKVGECSIQCNNVYECERLVGVAKQLTECAPTTIKSDPFAIHAGTVEQCAKATSVSKELADLAPIEAKFLGNKIKAGTLKKFFWGGVILVGLTLGCKYVVNRLSKKENDGDNDEPSDVSFHPKAESLNETLSKYNNGSHPTELIDGVIRYGGINLIASPTGEGKSILSMGIGITLATGQPSKLIQPEKDKSRTPIDVTVYDNEQDRDDIWERYGQSGITYPENLKRAFDCWFDDEKDFFKNLDQRVAGLTRDHVFIIDNVTSILPSKLTANRVKKFYRHLKKVQAECQERGFRITFIVIAHTIKDFKNPITLKDLAGAGELSALSNRVIVIWPTKWGEKTKGLQVLKNRDSVKGDVKVLNLFETPYAHFEYDRTITMQEAIEASYQSEIDRFLKGFRNTGVSNGERKKLNDNEKAEFYRKVIKLSGQGLTQKEIAQKLGTSEMAISRAVKEIKKRQEKSEPSQRQP